LSWLRRNIQVKPSDEQRLLREIELTQKPKLVAARRHGGPGVDKQEIIDG
jgi:hypothetical protein